jgi:hypothetical protein
MTYVKLVACAAVLMSGFASVAMADKSSAPGQQIAPGQKKEGSGAATPAGSAGASTYAPRKNK